MDWGNIRLTKDIPQSDPNAMDKKEPIFRWVWLGADIATKEIEPRMDPVFWWVCVCVFVAVWRARRSGEEGGEGGEEGDL